MDNRHRVYYYVSLNLNHKLGGWWCSGWDSYGIRYDKNLHMLRMSVPSLKLIPTHLEYRSPEYYQLKVSCKKEYENLLVDLLDKMPKTEYKKIFISKLEGATYET